MLFFSHKVHALWIHFAGDTSFNFLAENEVLLRKKYIHVMSFVIYERVSITVKFKFLQNLEFNRTFIAGGLKRDTDVIAWNRHRAWRDLNVVLTGIVFIHNPDNINVFVTRQNKSIHFWGINELCTKQI